MVGMMRSVEMGGDLLASLASLCGAEALAVDSASRQLAAHDIFFEHFVIGMFATSL